jgi:hypothetical protein
VALDLKDGRERWRADPAMGLAWVPLVYRDVLYAAGSKGVFAWLTTTAER